MKPRKPSKSRRPNKGRPKPTRRRSASRPAVRVQWENLKPLYDFWGKEFKRFYKLETLASAVEKRLSEHDTFILPSITGAMGQTPIVSLRFELFQEGKFQHIFRVQASSAKRKRGNFAFVAAKNAEEFSQLFIESRSFSFDDLSTNWIGMILGYFGAKAITLFRTSRSRA